MTLGLVRTDQNAATGPRWVRICTYERIQPERGVAALIEGVQVAIFRTFDGMLHAVGNQDPYTGAFVLSRGIVGTRGEVPTVASPLHKQVFDLRTGRSFDDAAVRIPVFPVRLVDGAVEVCAEEISA
jgi:nitrite reductase (NADH) small subunit